MRNRHHDQGFTLIELLVVITIIAILASISVPVYNSVTERAKITKVISNIKQINLACRTFAIDNDGLFPQGDETDDTGAPRPASSSTVAFGELVPDYVNVESIFYTAGQAATATKRIPNEDDNLLAFENCFAYVAGLTDSSPGNTPMIADWFTGGVGNYSETHIWWNSGKAVVGRADGSARAEQINKPGGTVEGAQSGSNLFGTRGATGRAGLIPPRSYDRESLGSTDSTKNRIEAARGNVSRGPFSFRGRASFLRQRSRSPPSRALCGCADRP